MKISSGKIIAVLASTLLAGVVAAQTPQDLPTHIKEGTDAFLSVSFKDQNGLPVTPQTVTWFVTDEATGVQLIGSTSIPTPVSNSTLTINVNKCASRIVQPGKAVENKLMTVLYTYGGTGQYEGTDVARWQVDNIPNIFVGTPNPTTTICGVVQQPTPTPTNTP